MPSPWRGRRWPFGFDPTGSSRSLLVAPSHVPCLTRWRSARRQVPPSFDAAPLQTICSYSPRFHDDFDARVVFVTERAVHRRRVFQTDPVRDDEGTDRSHPVRCARAQPPADSDRQVRTRLGATRGGTLTFVSAEVRCRRARSRDSHPTRSPGSAAARHAPTSTSGSPIASRTRRRFCSRGRRRRTTRGHVSAFVDARFVIMSKES